MSRSTLVRAGNGTRTRDPNLGKVVLYQLSYSRVGRRLGEAGLSGKAYTTAVGQCARREDTASDRNDAPDAAFDRHDGVGVRVGRSGWYSAL